MRLKYSISDVVYYYCSYTDRICLGRITAIAKPSGREWYEQVNYCVRNIHLDKDDDAYEDSITCEDIFNSEESIYLFLRECAYNRFCKHSEVDMDEEDFNIAFDEEHAMKLPPEIESSLYAPDNAELQRFRYHLAEMANKELKKAKEKNNVT